MARLCARVRTYLFKCAETLSALAGLCPTGRTAPSAARWPLIYGSAACWWADDSAISPEQPGWRPLCSAGCTHRTLAADLGPVTGPGAAGRGSPSCSGSGGATAPLAPPVTSARLHGVAGWHGRAVWQAVAWRLRGRAGSAVWPATGQAEGQGWSSAGVSSRPGLEAHGVAEVHRVRLGSAGERLGRPRAWAGWRRVKPGVP